MKNTKIITIFFVSILFRCGLTLLCYRCQTGYVTSEICSDQIPVDGVEECDQSNSQCYESVQWFNDGALRLAVRGCWTPPDNSTVGGFCENYEGPEGVLRYCRNCTTDRCNSRAIYQPIKLLNCHF